MIEATSEGKTVLFEMMRDLPERWGKKLCSCYAEVLAYEEAVNLIWEGYFQGNEVLFADGREYLTVWCERVELVSSFCERRA
jgi:hypothetical protein